MRHTTWAREATPTHETAQTHAHTSMRHSARAVLLSTIGMLTACEPAPREPAPRDPTPDATSALDLELPALLTDGERRGFQGAILVEVEGVRRLDAGVGTLSGSSTRRPDADTAFDCGSIMKEATAAALYLLEEDGLLSLGQTLGELFPDVPSVWRDATLDQVVTHRAGFDEYHDTEGDFEPMDRATALRDIFAQEPLFEPGTDSAYSNSGYTLLAAVIEQTTGEEYQSVIRQRVFEPLGMTRSGFYGDPLWEDGNVAVGSGADVFAGNDPSRWPEPTWALIGNGGLVSTLHDLLLLARALEGDGLFQPATLRAFRLLQRGGDIGGRALIGYAGGNDFGFDAVVASVPSDSTYVIAASHVAASIDAEHLAVEVLEALYGEELTEPGAD